MQKPTLPPFSSVLKSRDVEDPVNLWLHRPLAYGFVALFFGTPLTPNQITLLSTVVGLTSVYYFVEGSAASMVVAGALVWISAILDGADGILARAKRLSSDLGRALDGTADLVVTVAVVLGASYHLWSKGADPWLSWMIPLAFLSGGLHVYLYDYYKESYLKLTNRSSNGRFESREEVNERHRQLLARRAPWVERFASRLYCDLIRNQTWVVTRIDPDGLREGVRFQMNEVTAEVYKKYNRAPMRLWAWISLAPHCYLIAIFSMIDRLDLYIWLRVVLANVVFMAVVFLQRRGSRLARRELAEIGAPPIPLAAQAQRPA